MLENDKSLLAHYIINVGLLAVVVSSGAVMLFLVVREIHNRPDWKKIHVAFLSIWGLTCLFGTTWSLGFLDFGPMSETILFLFCLINSLQGKVFLESQNTQGHIKARLLCHCKLSSCSTI